MVDEVRDWLDGVEEDELVEQFHDAGIWLPDEPYLPPEAQRVHRAYQKRGMCGTAAELREITEVIEPDRALRRHYDRANAAILRRGP